MQKNAKWCKMIQNDAKEIHSESWKWMQNVTNAKWCKRLPEMKKDAKWYKRIRGMQKILKEYKKL